MEAPVRTRPLSPSKLSLALGCKLRYLLETESNDFFRISGSISSFLGQAVHNAIDAVVKNAILRSHDAIRRNIVAALLARVVAEKSMHPILDAIESPLNEALIVTPARLGKFCSNCF